MHILLRKEPITFIRFRRALKLQGSDHIWCVVSQMPGVVLGTEYLLSKFLLTRWIKLLCLKNCTFTIWKTHFF